MSRRSECSTSDLPLDLVKIGRSTAAYRGYLEYSTGLFEPTPSPDADCAIGGLLGGRGQIPRAVSALSLTTAEDASRR